VREKPCFEKKKKKSNLKDGYCERVRKKKKKNL
jgi:hypothetical protein